MLSQFMSLLPPSAAGAPPSGAWQSLKSYLVTYALHTLIGSNGKINKKSGGGGAGSLLLWLRILSILCDGPSLEVQPGFVSSRILHTPDHLLEYKFHPISTRGGLEIPLGTIFAASPGKDGLAGLWSQDSSTLAVTPPGEACRLPGNFALPLSSILPTSWFFLLILIPCLGSHWFLYFLPCHSFLLFFYPPWLFLLLSCPQLLYVLLSPSPCLPISTSTSHANGPSPASASSG